MVLIRSESTRLIINDFLREIIHEFQDHNIKNKQTKDKTKQNIWTLERKKKIKKLDKKYSIF